MADLAKVRNGRKYKLSLISIFVLLITFALSSLSPTLARLFPELGTALIGVLLVYCSGNVGNKWVSNKWPQQQPVEPPPEE